MVMDHKDVLAMEWKRGRVSGKRQITIPQKFFEQVGIQNEVEFSVKDQYILIRPVKEHTNSDQYADLILADLIKEGYQGDELLAKFREKQTGLREAVQHLIHESHKAAQQRDNDDQTQELFGDVMDD
ncbi:AbrB/MazE/SpoVT family DNA-binding domain-containing protein [Paenibacillus oryzae]|nr:AbrB/MazE/SpoVT family DNA-binding domain-containing protein [Paenibacillus oryzae]